VTPSPVSRVRARAILLDIEGTTTPVDFVYQELFPYARAHLVDYLAQHGDTAECRDAVALLRAEYAARLDPPADFSSAVIVRYVHDLMDHDRKSPGLKALQGLIWKDGYAAGALRGQVYPDVPPAFGRWRGRGLGIYIYSSGSVLAQRLLFSSVPSGDLTPGISGYFDTRVGPKREAASYAAIAGRIRVPPARMLFVSDAEEELDAAQEAGLRTALCIRAGETADRSAAGHAVVQTFDDLG
jgi:enolase-phosphatase E1